MSLVKGTNDSDVAVYVMNNLQDNPDAKSCYRGILKAIREEASRRYTQLCFTGVVTPGQYAKLRQPAYPKTVTTPKENLLHNMTVVQNLQKAVAKRQQDFVKQQIDKLLQQQRQEMASIWRDLMKIEDETLIRKMNDPNPMVSMLAIQVAGKKRLPVEKEAIGLLSSVNPTIRQAARQTLMRLGRGVDYGPDATASPQQVALSVRNWNSWLDVQGNADDDDDYDPPRTKSVGQTK